MTTRIYELPVDQTRWTIADCGQVVFDFNYDEGRQKLLNLYDKGKRLQWDGAQRLDWEHQVDPDDPLGVPEVNVPIWDHPVWKTLSETDKGRVRRHLASWNFSQFLHGEQGALICTARIVQDVPDLDAKFYGATQVMDEARHMEVYSRFLREKIGFAYPINPHLKTLLEQIIGHRQWDFVYLGMQILIEGLALAAFNLIRDFATDPLARTLNAYVMQDEARHVAFGRMALRDYYPQLTDRERDEREEFVVEACYLMRDRFTGAEMWRNLGFGGDVIHHVETCANMQRFRSLLFSRIVPALRDIGLWGTRVQRAFKDMGVIGFANVDLDAMGAHDEQMALELERQLRAQQL